MEETNINFTFILSFNPPASHGGRFLERTKPDFQRGQNRIFRADKTGFLERKK